MVTYEEMIDMINDQRKPFTEEHYGDYIIRHFDPSYPEHLFKWHWDNESRRIIALNESDWKFQFDNEMPINLTTESIISIPKGTIHRVIKGTVPLSVKILLD